MTAQPSAAATTSSEFMASPFTHSIGMRRPVRARAASGSRARARRRQPCLARAAAAWPPNEPVAPMIRAVRGALRVDMVLGLLAVGAEDGPAEGYSELSIYVGLICSFVWLIRPRTGTCTALS